MTLNKREELNEFVQMQKEFNKPVLHEKRKTSKKRSNANFT